MGAALSCFYEGAVFDFSHRHRLTFAAGNHVATLWTVSGTHQADFMGIPATHKRGTVRGCTITELSDGKITKSATYSDRLTLFQQLGLAKSASAS